MKKSFTKEYILKNRGCYSESKVNDLPFTKNDTITLSKLFKVLPIKDFSWFLAKKCELTTKQKQLFAVHCAEQVLPIYESKYPNDSRVRGCIEATKQYINGEIKLDNLHEKRAAAYAAAYAYAYAYDAAAYAAAYAAADAAAAAYDAAYAYDAAAAAAAADADDDDDDDAYNSNEYKQSIFEFIKQIS